MAVTLSTGVRQSLSALQSSAAQSSVIQNRLATGKKVNSALDNPASFFTASGLSNRANDLSSLLDSMGQSVKTLEAADKGIKAITKLVENAQSIAKQASASASSNIKAEGTAALAAAAAADAGTINISVGGTSSAVAIADGDTVDEIVAAFNAVEGVRASLNDDGELVLEALNGESLEIEASSTDATATHIGITEGAKTRATADVNATRKNAAADFNSIREQINQLAKDAGYNGTNLIAGDSMKVLFNEKGTSKLDVKGTNLDSAGLGVSASAGDFQATSDIEAALTELKAAMDTLRQQASTFGANLSVVQNRQEFTRGMVDTLQSGSDALVIADPNEEGASLLALNTRSQIAQTTLSMASQADSAVLRLF
jgi:flagellin-like hook-associated protein FlgL